MAILWPADLQQLLNQTDFQETFPDTVLRSDMNQGPAKLRRRFTKGVYGYTCSITLDFDDYATFRDFFNVDLNGGVNQFQFTDPMELVDAMFRFAGVPNITPLGGRKFTVRMAWEKLPT